MYIASFDNAICIMSVTKYNIMPAERAMPEFFILASHFQRVAYVYGKRHYSCIHVTRVLYSLDCHLSFPHFVHITLT